MYGSTMPTFICSELTWCWRISKYPKAQKIIKAFTPSPFFFFFFLYMLINKVFCHQSGLNMNSSSYNSVDFRYVCFSFFSSPPMCVQVLCWSTMYLWKEFPVWEGDSYPSHPFAGCIFPSSNRLATISTMIANPQVPIECALILLYFTLLLKGYSLIFLL